MSVEMAMWYGDSTMPDKTTIVEYYDYMNDRFMGFKFDNIPREFYPKRLKEKEVRRYEDNGNIDIVEQIYREIRRESRVDIGDVYDPSESPPIIYSDNIKDLIEQFRNGKQQLIWRGDRDFWEYYIEIRLITMCKFALQRGYGIMILY